MIRVYLQNSVIALKGIFYLSDSLERHGLVKPCSHIVRVYLEGPIIALYGLPYLPKCPESDPFVRRRDWNGCVF